VGSRWEGEQGPGGWLSEWAERWMVGLDLGRLPGPSQGCEGLRCSVWERGLGPWHSLLPVAEADPEECV
jgi:hypothetical protein